MPLPRHTRALLLATVLSSVACVESVDLEQPAPKDRSSPTSAAAAGSPALSGTFVDREMGYSLSFPADWKLQDHQKQGGLIRADISRGSQVGVQVRVDRTGGDDFDAYVDRYETRFRNDMSAHWKGGLTGAQRECGVIGNAAGCKLSATLRRGDGQEWWLVQYLWPHDTRVVILEAGAPAATRRDNEPLIQRVADSVQLSPVEHRR